MQVSAPLAQQHRRWLLVLQSIAGVCENSCRITCRRPVGPHPSTVGVPRRSVNALLSAGAEITVSCGATRARESVINITLFIFEHRDYGEGAGRLRRCAS